jgi:hypothetical protein
MTHDLVVRNVRVVRPNVREVVQADIAIAGRIEDPRQALA